MRRDKSGFSKDSCATITLAVYSHVMPAMNDDAATTIATLIDEHQPGQVLRFAVPNQVARHVPERYRARLSPHGLELVLTPTGRRMSLRTDPTWLGTRSP